MKPIAYLADWAIPYYGTSRFDLASSGLPDTNAAVPECVRGTGWDQVNGLRAVSHARARIASIYDCSPACVTLTFGGSGGLFMMAFVMAQRGRAAVVESPNYEPLHRNFEALGCEVRFLDRPPEDGYSLRTLCRRAAELARGAACLVITNPNNPAGAYDDQATIEAMARAIYPAWLIVNEAYLPLVTGGATAFGAAENVCVIGTLTKAYGIGTPRFAWTVAPERLAKEFGHASTYLNGGYSGTVAAAVLPVLEGLSACLAKATEHLEGRHAAVDRAIAASARVRWKRPPGLVTIALATIEGVTDDMAFAKALLREEGVITAPGWYFRAPGRLRLSLGSRPDQFREGFSRFLDFAGNYREERELEPSRRV